MWTGPYRASRSIGRSGPGLHEREDVVEIQPAGQIRVNPNSLSGSPSSSMSAFAADVVQRMGGGARHPALQQRFGERRRVLRVRPPPIVQRWQTPGVCFDNVHGSSVEEPTR